MQDVLEFDYRSPRFVTDFYFFLQSAPDQPFKKAFCSEISEFGLRAQVLDPLLPGAVVNLLFTLPKDSRTLRIAAKVTNRRGSSYGFAFLYASAADRVHVRHYLTSTALTD